MEQHLRGEYKAAAAGGKLYAFINAMQKAGVCCRKQRCQGNTYQFRFYAKHCKTVQELAQANGVQLELTPCRTLQSFLYRNHFRFGVPLGIYQESFHEYRTRLLTLTPAEAAQNVEEQIQRYEDNFLSNVEILNKKTTVLETEDGVTYTVIYTLQGEIGVQQELYLH